MIELPAPASQTVENLLIQGGMAALFRPGVMRAVSAVYAAGFEEGRAQERRAQELTGVRADVQRSLSRLPARVG